MPHIHLGFLIPVIYSFGKTTSLKVMNLKTTLQIKAPKNVGGKNAHNKTSKIQTIAGSGLFLLSYTVSLV